MTRPSAEARREQYLEIGARLAMGFDADAAREATVDALADVKVADVADLAGVTKGAIYHIWPSQEEYRKDLLRRLLELNRQSGIRRIKDFLDGPVRDVGNARELLARYGDVVFEELKDDPAFFARFSFFLYTSHRDVADALAAGDDAMVEDFTPFVEQYLAFAGRTMREPFTIEHLLRATNALFHGLCLRYRTSPDLLGREIGPEQLGPAAFGMQSLFEYFSEPLEETGD